MSGDPITIGSDLTVGRIGLGAMRLTGEQLWGPYPDEAAGVRFLRDAVDAGITLIDTVDVYGPRTNEQLIHDALRRTTCGSPPGSAPAGSVSSASTSTTCTASTPSTPRSRTR